MSARHLADVCQVKHDWPSQLSSEMALLYVDIRQMSIIQMSAGHLADVCQVNHNRLSQLSSEMALLYMDIWQMS